MINCANCNLLYSWVALFFLTMVSVTLSQVVLTTYILWQKHWLVYKPMASDGVYTYAFRIIHQLDN